MASSALMWVSMFAPLLLLPGVTAVIPARSLRTEGRKLALLQEQDDVDSYSPWAFSGLREWIRADPDDPYSPIACRRYDECVRSLRVTDEPYYDWSDERAARPELADE